MRSLSQSFFRAALLVGAILSVACSSSSSSGSQSACILNGACTLSIGLTAQSLGAVQADCTEGKGTIASSCPTAGLISCCIETSEGASQEDVCIYGDSGAPGDPTATTFCMQ